MLHFQPVRSLISFLFSPSLLSPACYSFNGDGGSVYRSLSARESANSKELMSPNDHQPLVALPPLDQLPVDEWSG